MDAHSGIVVMSCVCVFVCGRRDAKGCSNGCFVLGYRVYINGTSRVSVDGPMSHETTMRWPHVDSNHKITVHVR